ncbi:klcB [Salmonella enterica subsp. enterica serovar Typhimurium]|nr:klcB [Salmonella enterica subsp. enterica serovar Typhimurium]EBY8246131.1 klcB [Salmonella enterica subsp. enterica serovar Typhimurium]
MKKTISAQCDELDDLMAGLAASMPSDLDGLLAVARAAVDELHAGVMACDDAAVELATNRYEAATWKLNGGTFFGCQADQDAAGCVIDRHCSAAPGDVPCWGQAGQFLVEVEGLRALVDFGGGIGAMGCHFAFNVVDLDKPFISETGYRSHFDRLRGGMTVDAVAAAIFAAILKDKRPRRIEPDSRDRLASYALPAWTADLVPQPCREPATVDVPKGFVLVDVVLPAHRAFIARKWAAEAKAKIKAAEAAELYAKEEAAGGFRPGARCEVVSVHHHVFKKEIGKKIIITKVSHDTRQVWAHDDRPARYRTNRNGRRVTEYDPRCVESCYGFDQLRILSSPGENRS